MVGRVSTRIATLERDSITAEVLILSGTRPLEEAATAGELAAALKRAGVGRVDVWTLCRAGPDR